MMRHCSSSHRIVAGDQPLLIQQQPICRFSLILATLLKFVSSMLFAAELTLAILPLCLAPMSGSQPLHRWQPMDTSW